jgi:pimeloyl-ACP methyl ester carboxylesterase
MAGWQELRWTSADGLTLSARDYPGGGDGRPPILCLPGLTRNARDWEAVAERLAPAWRVIAVDFRGRGESDYAKDPMSYVPATYAADVDRLLADQGIGRFVAFGTSLGGIVAMLMAGAGAPIAGALLNDVGPAIEPAGLGRIRGYVGRSSTWPTWMHAARCLRDMHRDAHPGFDTADWLAMAKRLYYANAAGRIVLDYDLRIAEPFRVVGGEAPPDMWPMLAKLGQAPVLVVRGALSDVLSAATAQRMADSVPDAELVTVPDTGHAPLLSEPEVVPAIDRLLARISRGAARN